ncbi:MAG: hypothetical protein ACLQMF_00350 [Rectinemataceae bacterium]
MDARRFIIPTAMALLALAALGAQTPETRPPEAQPPTGAASYYFTLGADGQPVFTQVLRWDADQNALEYQVLVRDSTGAEILSKRGTEVEEKLHLAPGSYTYKIVTYNLLGKAEAETDWIGFTVIRAEQPKLSAVSPSAIYMDASDGRVVLTGDKLLPGGVVSLVPLNGKPPSVGTVVERKENKEVVVLFPDKAYEPGDYSLSFADPGGLSATLDRALRIRFQRPVDLLVSLGYAPYVPLGDPWAVGAWPGAFKLLGFQAGIDLYFIKQRWGFLGLEAGAQWRRMYGGEPEATLTSDFGLMGMDVLYKYRFSRELHGLAKLGGGLAWSYHSFDYEGSTGPTASSYDPFAQAGIALQAFLPSKLYGEIGVDCTCIFLIGNYALGIAPRLGIGYQIF